MYYGAAFDMFDKFDTNDFEVRFDIATYPRAPYFIMNPKGKFENTKNLWFNHLARARALFVAPESGKYTFYLVCKTRCQLDISEVGFSVYVLATKTVGADLSLDNYKTYVFSFSLIYSCLISASNNMVLRVIWD